MSCAEDEVKAGKQDNSSIHCDSPVHHSCRRVGDRREESEDENNGAESHCRQVDAETPFAQRKLGREERETADPSPTDAADGDHVARQQGNGADGHDDVERNCGADVDAVEDTRAERGDDDRIHRHVVPGWNARYPAMERDAFVSGEGEHLSRGSGHGGKIGTDVEDDKDAG